MVNKQQSRILDKKITIKKKEENSNPKSKVRYSTKATMPSIAEISHTLLENSSTLKASVRDKLKRLQSLPNLKESKKKDEDFDEESPQVSLIEDLPGDPESVYKYLEGWLSSSEGKAILYIALRTNKFVRKCAFYFQRYQCS